MVDTPVIRRFLIAVKCDNNGVLNQLSNEMV